jgi:hypothetical protein
VPSHRCLVDLCRYMDNALVYGISGESLSNKMKGSQVLWGGGRGGRRGATIFEACRAHLTGLL